MRFTKVQSVGNDFILVEADNISRDWSPVAVSVCDRHFGVGADGLLLLLPSDKADFGMRIFNPDGSEAEACGNGLRCLAKYIFDMGLVSAGVQEVLVETVAGVRKAKFTKEGEDKVGKPTKIQVGMGVPEFEAKKIPVEIKQSGDLVDIKSMLGYPVVIEDRELLLNFVSMGNPHAVYFWQRSVSDFPLVQIGSQVEQLDIFPNRVNFEVARVLNRQQIEVGVWERGVGETLACGTGACAVAVAAHKYGYIDNKVDIILTGGTVGVEWDGAGEVLLSGVAEVVFNGEWLDENIKTS